MLIEDERWMRCALEMAHRAEQQGEVPVGSVLVKDNQLIAEGWNQSIVLNDPTAHAEIIALRSAAQFFNNYRLPGCFLYVTLEPCLMCFGAMIHARVEKLVYGAQNHKSDDAGEIFSLIQSNVLNHTLNVSGGVLESECAELLRGFFKIRRN